MMAVFPQEVTVVFVARVLNETAAKEDGCTQDGSVQVTCSRGVWVA